MKIIFYLLLLIILYNYYSKEKIDILKFLILIFILNIYFLLINKDINVILGLLITLIIFLIERLYNYLYLKKSHEVKQDDILIKNGNINFKGLVGNKYSFNRLMTNLKRKGFNNLNQIDYCALYHNNLVVFTSNIKNYPVNLVVDGKVIYNNLFALKKDKTWLIDSLKENNLVISDISYAFYKDDKLYFLTNV